LVPLHAADVVAGYEARSFEQVHRWLLDRLPRRRRWCWTSVRAVVEMLHGSPREATRSCSRTCGGFAGAREAAPSVAVDRWLDDRLPGLQACHALGVVFDVILVSAVWMHLPPDERERGFRKLITLLRPADSSRSRFATVQTSTTAGCTRSRSPNSSGSRCATARRSRTAAGKRRKRTRRGRMDQIVVRLHDDGTVQCRCCGT
jgi:hypothetical protein